MINIAEILKDVPEGTKLYSPVFGECQLGKMIGEFIEIKDSKCRYFSLNAFGQYFNDGGECLLFPSKENRDWRAFEHKTSCPFKPFDKVLVRDDLIWHISLFERFAPEERYPYCCINCAWKQCIPYNEETAKLIGTTDDYAG